MRFAAGEGLRAAFSLIDDFAGFAARIFGEELLAATGARVDESLGDELFEDLLEKVKMTALDALAVVLEA